MVTQVVTELHFLRIMHFMSNRLFRVPGQAILAAWLILTAGLIPPGPALAVELRPHQATYRMSLAPGSSTMDIASAEGVMVYRASRECAGWAVENHTVIRYGHADGNSVEDKWTFLSWEGDDGLSYRFRVLHEANRQIDRIEGTASLDAARGPGVANFTVPAGLEVALPAGTVFPTEHLRQLLQAAQAGEKMFTRVVFDGTTEDNPYLVNVIIAPLRDRTTPPLAEAAGAPAAAAYWTQGAFFPYWGAAELPEFEMSIELRDDGIAELMDQRFDDIALRGKLMSVEILHAPDC